MLNLGIAYKSSTVLETIKDFIQDADNYKVNFQGVLHDVPGPRTDRP
jgi:hypothetical protein